MALPDPKATRDIGTMALRGSVLNPENGATIDPSQPIEIWTPFGLDLTTVNVTNVKVEDTILDYDLGALAAVVVEAQNNVNDTRGLITIRPVEGTNFAWRSALKITINTSVLKKTGGAAFDGGSILRYFIKPRSGPTWAMQPEQITEMVSRAGSSEPWKQQKADMLQHLNQDIYKVARVPYSTRPLDKDECLVMYGGSYNNGRGGNIDAQWSRLNAVLYHLTGDVKYAQEALDTIVDWAEKFPIGAPDNAGKWIYCIYYDIMLLTFAQAWDLIPTDLYSLGTHRTVEAWFRKWGATIQAGHEKTGGGGNDPENVRSWDNSAFMLVYAVTGDFEWRNYALGTSTTYGTNPKDWYWMWDEAIDSVNGSPRVHDRYRGGQGRPYYEITYPIYHLQALLSAVRTRFMVDGKLDLWEHPHPSYGWTMNDLLEEYQKAVRCDSGSGFDTVEGYCVEWDDEWEENGPELRRVNDAWKLSEWGSLFSADQGLFELVQEANRGDYSVDLEFHYAAPRGPVFSGYPLPSYHAGNGGPHKPTAPTGLVVVPGRSFIKVTWDAPSSIVDERDTPLVYIITLNGVERGRTNHREFVVSSGVTPGTPYTLRVKAMNAAGQTSKTPITVTTLGL